MIRAALWRPRSTSRPRRSLVVVDTSYPSWTIGDWGTWEAVTCRDLDGYFDEVLTVNPIATAAPGGQTPGASFPQTTRISQAHTFVDGTDRYDWRGSSRYMPRALQFFIAQSQLLVQTVQWGRHNGAVAVRAGDVLYAGLFGLATARILGVPLVVRVGGNNARMRRELGRALMSRLFRVPAIEELVELLVLRNASAVLAANSDYLEFAVQSGADRTRCHVIRYGNLIDRDHFVAPSARLNPQSYLDEYGISGGVSIIMYVGRLEEAKRVDDVVQVCRRLRDDGHEFTCLLIGEGSEERQLREELGRFDLNDRVLLCGSRTQEWLASVLPRASVVVSPLTGRALTEAALAGAPVVAYDVDWQSEIIEHGVTGLLAPFGDVEALTAGAEYLLANPESAAKLGWALRQRALAMMDPMMLNSLEIGVYQGLKSDPAPKWPKNRSVAR